ncbi:MAG: MGMT family protein [Anaerolineae bacterium]
MRHQPYCSHHSRHRVVRQDGEMGGYKWGLQRKAELLRREHEQAS